MSLYLAFTAWFHCNSKKSIETGNYGTSLIDNSPSGKVIQPSPFQDLAQSEEHAFVKSSQSKSQKSVDKYKYGLSPLINSAPVVGQNLNLSQSQEQVSLQDSQSQEQSFVCTVCLKKLKHKASLAAHMRIHTGYTCLPVQKSRGQFTCGICTFTTKDLVSWKSHELSSGHRQSFACPVCGKKFTQKCNMKAHTRLHTGEKPYQCKFCHQTFTYQSALRGHTMSHHKISASDSGNMS
ncbi:hypothetical protein TNCV_792041 [Trichonephila clavipes]|nr:hypothetical protein TNCV_792041 [Trichonephila clavipes]